MDYSVFSYDDPKSFSLVWEQYSEILLRLTRRMFHQFPTLKRWEQTDDIFQMAIIRLQNSIPNCKIESREHFLNFAKLQIRRVLLDLARKYKSEKNFAANHHTDALNPDLVHGMASKQSNFLEDLDPWIEFHIQIEGLPEDLRKIVDLVWYENLSIVDAAKKLQISERTARRRWQMARLHLAVFLKPPA